MSNSQIVNAIEMKNLDKLTIQEKGITSYELMTHAAKEIFTYLLSNRYLNSSEQILVVAGTGNNGGDALLTAFYIIEHGLNPTIILIGKEEQQSEESLKAYHQLLEHNIVIKRVDDRDSFHEFEHMFESSSLVIDGIFGIGLSRDVEGYHRDVIGAINGSFAKVISIDIPSGLSADNGVELGQAIYADITLVMQNLKQGNLLNDAKDHTGRNIVLDIGILQTFFQEQQVLLDSSYLKNKIPRRKSNSHKYHFGHILTIGGNKGMMGAPLLSGLSALRTGAGLSGVLYRERLVKYIPNFYPDIMVNSYMGIEEIPEILRKKSCVIFGPGLGTNDAVNKDVLSYLLSTEIPLVVDADGLFYLKQLLREYSERQNIVITPHYKEMANFLDVTVEEVAKEPVLFAKNIAHTFNVTVVLKGTCTLITNSDETFFSNEGNAGLATAGTGDVLSGIIGALLGRGYSPLEASKIGVLIHSKAAMYAQEKFGETSMMASDVITYISEVIKNA